MTPNAAITKAIEIAGGSQAKLAERSGLSQAYISLLLRNARSVSAEAAIAISRATDGIVLIRDLVPDIAQAVTAEAMCDGAFRLLS